MATTARNPWLCEVCGKNYRETVCCYCEKEICEECAVPSGDGVLSLCKQCEERAEVILPSVY